MQPLNILRNFSLRISRYSEGISSVNPLVYLSFYILSIPAFGLVYTIFVPHLFYSPYAKYENIAKYDAAKITELLSSSIANYIEVPNDGNLITNNWRILPESIKVVKASAVEEQYLKFIFSVDAVGINDLHNAKRYSWQVKAKANYSVGVKIKHKNETLVFRPIEYDLPDDNSVFIDSNPFHKESLLRQKEEDLGLIRLLFSHRHEKAIMFRTMLAVNENTDKEIRGYLRGIHGDPHGFSGTFGRMTYFSSVIITTLGLGDIVPTENASRFLVALESISGVTLLGLFLNALAYRASKPGSQGKPNDPAE